MLIVLAVFSILAVMFMISSNHAMTKSRYARTLQDQRTITLALQRYVADYFRYPDEQEGLAELTKPGRGMLGQVPHDIFDEQQSQYAYFARFGPGNYQTLVVSVGPDGDADVGEVIDAKRREESVNLVENRYRFLFKTPDEAKAFVIEHSYDPTNGSLSNGDIITPLGF